MELKLLVTLEFQLNTSLDRSEILKLRKNTLLKSGKSVVYIYSLVNDDINYPKMQGRVLYVGQALREKSNTGERFQHIAPDKEKGNNFNNNYGLTQFYYSGKKMRLDIYETPYDVNLNKLEEALIYWHVYLYGAKPIAQGTNSGGFKKIKRIITETAGLDKYLNNY